MSCLPSALEVTAVGQERLARLGVPLPDWPERLPAGQSGIVCRVDEDVQLIWVGVPSGPGPLRIDFLAGSMAHRQRVRGKERLLDAVRPRKGQAPQTVLDATGGLGRDSWMLACSGLQVTVCERHPLVALLLADALLRARDSDETASIAGRIHLVVDDAHHLMCEEQVVADVVYLDPMFPPREKSAAVKREMQYLHGLLGSETGDEPALLTAARQIARQRIVVKRPRRAPPLGGIAPHHQVVGKRGRFDVYLPLQN